MLLLLAATVSLFVLCEDNAAAVIVVIALCIDFCYFCFSKIYFCLFDDDDDDDKFVLCGVRTME